MKISLKIISALLCMLIVSACLPFSAFAAESGTYGIFSYEYEYGKIIITDCEVPENGVVVIPDVIGNNFVTRIGEGAFKGTNVKNILIPDGVDTIDTEAFHGCTSLELIAIPTSVEFVEGNAFWNCSGIKTVCYYDTQFSEIKSGYDSWSKIQIGDGNEFMDYAARCYHSHENAETETVGYVASECEAGGYTGDKYFVECGVIAEIGTVTEKNGHTSGGWKVVDEPTLDAVGKEEERCSICKELLNEREIPKLIGIENIVLDKSFAEILNASTIQLAATVNPENASNVTVRWSSDNTAVATVSNSGLVTAKGLGEAVITVTAKGENGTFTDECKVVVYPREFTIKWVTESGTTTETVKEESEITKPADPVKSGYTFAGWTPDVLDKMPAKDMTFTAKFVLIAHPDTSLGIEKSSVEKINYGDTLILHAKINEMPKNAVVEWSLEGTGAEIEPSEDGMTCAVTSTGNGDIIVKAKLVDENGEDIIDEKGNSIEASRKLVSKAGFFQKLISFFKNLFGSNRIIEK